MRLRYLGVSIAVFAGASIFKILPLGAASSLGGRVARFVGPHLRRHEIARKNFQRALPDRSEAVAQRALTKMWDNFGRTIAEFVHLAEFARLMGDRHSLIEFDGLDRLKRLRKDHRSAIFISGHMGNWELAPLIVHHAGFETVVIYHPFHEPYVDRLARKCRGAINPRLMANKGQERELVAALRGDLSLCMLVDQKPRRGPLMEFLGHDAKTETAPAKLALRYGVPIVPIRVQRLKGVQFKITAYPPIDTTGVENGESGVAEITAAINKVLEGWIRECPADWHWVHRRWPD
ncbi:MAG: lauroyl acyltransferase [Alphaproteobacteria bacterium]|nr:lauroyl acyltransferase [Alphaproteobacteria bacterium]